MAGNPFSQALQARGAAQAPQPAAQTNPFSAVLQQRAAPVANNPPQNIPQNIPAPIAGPGNSVQLPMPPDSGAAAPVSAVAAAPPPAQSSGLVAAPDGPFRTLPPQPTVPNPVQRFLTPEQGRVDVADVGRAIGQGVVGDFAGRTAEGLSQLMEVVDRNLGQRAVSGLRRAGMEPAAVALETIRGATPDFLDPIKLTGRAGQALRGAGEAIGPEDRNFGTAVAGGTGQLAGQIVTLLLTGGAVSGLQLAGQGASIQGDAIDRADVDPSVATDVATLGGAAVTALTERFGLGVLLNKIPGIKNYLGRILVAAGSEGSQEIVEAVGQNLVTLSLIDPTNPLFEGVGEEGAVATAVGGIAGALIPGRRGTAPPPVEQPVDLDQEAPPTRDDLAADIADPRTAEEIEAARQKQQADAARAAAREVTAGRQRVIDRNQLPAPGEPITVTDADGAVISGTLIEAQELAIDGEVVDQLLIEDAATGETLLFDADEIRVTQGDGTQAKPVRVETAQDLEVAAAQVDPDPTEAQKEAENYKQGHVNVQGLDITIETTKGGTRRKLDENGQELWSVVLTAHYGKVMGTEGADGDHVDVYIGDAPDSQQVWIVDQIDPDSNTFDEHKALIGFPDATAALEAYVGAFNDGSGPSRAGAVVSMDINQFKQWLKTGNTKAPLKFAPAPAPEVPPAPQIAEVAPEPVETPPPAPPEQPPRATSRPGRQPTPPDLLRFLAAQGGIRDDEGHNLVVGRNARRFVPGQGPLIRPNGMSIDAAGELLHEAGFFGDPNSTPRPSESDVLDVLDDALGGRRVVSSIDEGAEQDRQQAREADVETELEQDALAEVQRVADEMGEKFTDDERVEIATQMRATGATAEELITDLAERLAIEFEEAYTQETGESLADEPSGPDQEFAPPAPSPEAVDQDQGEGPARAEAAEEGRDDAGEAQQPPELATEQTDQGTQTLVPGVAPVTDTDRIEAQADAPLRSTRAQQPADDGLFDVAGRGQLDLVQQAQAPKVDFTENDEGLALEAVEDFLSDALDPLQTRNVRPAANRFEELGLIPAGTSQRPAKFMKDEIAKVMRSLVDTSKGVQQLNRAGLPQTIINTPQRLIDIYGAQPTHAPTKSVPGPRTEADARELAVEIAQREVSGNFNVPLADRDAERGFRYWFNPARTAININSDVQGAGPFKFHMDDLAKPTESPAWFRSTTPEGRRQLAVAAGFPPKEAVRISKINWPNMPGDIAERLGAQSRRGDIQQEPSSPGVKVTKARIIPTRAGVVAEPLEEAQTTDQEVPDAERQGTGTDGQGALADTPAGGIPQAGGQQAGEEVLPRPGRAGPRAGDQDTGRAGGREPAVSEGLPGQRATPDTDGPASAGDGSTGNDIAAGLRDSKGNRSGRVHGLNHRIDKLDLPRGAKTRARNNIEVIKLLKKIEGEGRQATADEQAQLVTYVGWGGIPQAFDARNKSFADIFGELNAALGPEEYDAARASTPNAHYTSETIVRAMWQLAEHIGFKGGRVLEPGAGVGHFFGLLPDGMAKKSPLVGVELDSITGRIAKLLYPQAEIHVDGFENVVFPDNHFDLAIGNVPFGNFKVHDPRYNKLKLSIHDYFFAKALDRVRPGGVVAFITSHFTMDKSNSKFREWLAERADLVGAIRLPATAFKGNAGTEVVTDIIVLKKRAEGEKPGKQDAWSAATDVGGVLINEYFSGNPRMVLGRIERTGTMHGVGLELTVTGELTQDLLDGAIGLLPADVMTPAEIVAPQTRPQPAIEGRTVGADSSLLESLREGEHFTRGDRIMVKRSGVALSAQPKRKSEAPKIKGLIKIRDAAMNVLETQLSEKSADAARAVLNKQYDAFEKAHGPIGKVNVTKSGARLFPNMPTAFRTDPGKPVVMALETFDNEGNASKTAIFFKDVITKRPTVSAVDSPADAVPVVLDELGRLDMDRVAELSGVSKLQAIEELRGITYLNPDGNVYETASDYLSGNVRRKLDAARAAGLKENVEALEKVQPTDLLPAEIVVKMGAPWVPAEDVAEFLTKEVLESTGAPATAKYIRPTSRWSIKGTGPSNKFGTSRVKPIDIATKVMNAESITVRDTSRNPDGTTTSVVNEKATAEARSKAKELSELFSEWIWRDPKRATRLAIKYNYEMNAIVPRQFDGSYLTLPGLSPVIRVKGKDVPFDLRDHQRNTVARIVQRGNTLMAHVVGAGKTFTMIAAGMEMKRLGLVRKPAYSIPNHMLEQFSREFLQAYPAAKLLIADKQNFTGDNRKTFVARIATEDVDAVIITHSAFSRIPVSRKYREQFLRKEVADYVSFIDEAKREEGKSGGSVKELEKAKKSAQARLETLLNTEAKDDGIEFEQTGIDFVFVDEAHLFKNLSFATRMQNVRGLAQGNAQRATDLFLKIQYLEGLNPGRSSTFATGTPISNTMAEMFTMMRYLQLGDMKDHGIENFDAWAKSFGNVTDSVELKPSGKGFRVVSRFSEFINIPDLINIWSNTADVQTAEMLKLPTPKLEGGEIQVVDVEATDRQRAFVVELAARAEAMKGKRPEKGGDNILKIVGEGRKAAMDMRLLEDGAPPGNKIRTLVDKAFAIWKRDGGPRQVQMIFADLGTPGGKKRTAPDQNDGDTDTDAEVSVSNAGDIEVKYDDEGDAGSVDTGWNAYTEIRKQLVAKGVPEAEIAFIHDANTDAKKGLLFDKARRGEVRFLIGSTAKMGMGTNVQNVLYAMHHLDAPWKPADVEQRDGRIMRQGNDNKEVQILRYVTKGTFDAYMWQILTTKAKFISQIMSGAKGKRVVEDVDAVLPEAATIMAIATGDERFLRQAELNQDVQELTLLRRAHAENQHRLKIDAGSMPAQIKSLRDTAKAMLADAKHVTDLSGDNFIITVGSKEYTDRKKANAAIAAAIRKKFKGAAVGENFTAIRGEISGLEFAVIALKESLDFNGVSIAVQIEGEATHQGTAVQAELAKLGEIDFSTRLSNILNRVAEVAKVRDKRADALQDRLASTQKELGVPFKREQEFQDKSEELVKLNDELNDDTPAPEKPGPADVDDAIEDRPNLFKTEFQPSVEPQLSELADKIARLIAKIAPRANLQMSQDQGEAIYLPDGKLLGVREGRYTPTRDLIRVALAGREPEFVASHEAIHHLSNIGVFTPEEWQILTEQADAVWREQFDINDRYAEYVAQNFKRRTPEGIEAVLREEAIADAYATWRASEADSKLDPAIKKIFRKIRAFWNRLRNFLRGQGFQNVEDVFAKIERGAVGKRRLPIEGVATRLPQGERVVLVKEQDELTIEEAPTPAYASLANHEPNTIRDGLFGRTFDHTSETLRERLRKTNVLSLASLSQTINALADPVRVKLQDKFLSVKRMQEEIAKARKFVGDLPENIDTYLREELMHGIVGEKLDRFKTDMVDPLIQAIHDANLTLEEVELYLYARHAPERNRQIAKINPDLPDGGSGMTNAEAAEIMEDLAPIIDDLEAIAARVDAINREGIRIRLESGLIDKGTAGAWQKTYQHYVPLRGFDDVTGIEGPGVARPRTGEGFDIRGPESKRAMGRTSKAADILANTLSIYEEAVVRAEKNKVGQTFLAMVESNPHKDLWEVSKKARRRVVDPTTGLVTLQVDPLAHSQDNVLAVKIKGKIVYITIHHDGIARAMKNLGVESTNLAVRALMKLNRWLAAVNTSFNPEFVISNFARDMETALINMTQHEVTGLRRSVLRDVAKALQGAYGGIRGKNETEWQNHYHDYAASGGKIAFFGLVDIETRRRDLNRSLRNLRPGNAQKVRAYARGAFQYVQDVNGAVENAVRLATYVNLRKAGVNKERAASAARNLTVNFNRKGEMGPFVNALYLFFNAGLQGTSTMMHALQHRGVQKLVGGIVATSFTTALINSLMSPEDDDGIDAYDKISQWTKDNNIIIMNPIAGADGNPVALKIPTAYGYNWFWAMGVNAADVIRGQKSPMRAAADQLSLALNVFNPLGSSEDIRLTMTPTALKPGFELGFNQNFAGSQIAPENNPFTLPKPDSKRYWNSVSDVSRVITDQINRLTGGNEVRPGAIDVSPETLDHLFDFIGGAMSTTSARVIKFPIRALQGDLTFNDVPFGRKVIEGRNLYFDRNRYREIQRAALTALEERESLIASRQPERAARASAKYRIDLLMVGNRDATGTIKWSESRLTKLRKARRAIEANRSIGAAEKRARLERNDTVQAAVINAVIKRHTTFTENQQ